MGREYEKRNISFCQTERFVLFSRNISFCGLYIPAFNPIRDYLDSLPQWDGKNHVAELFGRLPGITTEQLSWCSVWLRSVVAHWMGMDPLHGNECVPVLIGPQGCGKSTFAVRLLPEHLRQYYLDHINFGNKFDCDMALTHNLLVTSTSSPTWDLRIKGN